MNFNFDEIVDRSYSDSVKYGLRKRLYGTDDVLPLWVADMDFRTPSFIVDAVKASADHGIYGYTLNPQDFNQAIQDWVKRKYHWDIQTSWITGCPGVVPSLVISILAFTEPQDKIIIQSPVYPPFFSIITDNNRALLVNELIESEGRYFMDFDDLEEKAALGAKMLILCNPHNPVCRVWNKEELLQLAQICEKYDIIILTDDIHADIVFTPHQYIPIASISDQVAQRTISCFSPSKTFNMAGLATSWAVISNPELNKIFRDKLDALHLNNGNYFGPKALSIAYINGDEWLRQAIVYIEKNMDFVAHYLQKYIPEITMTKPEGTYLIWLNCKGLGMSDQELKSFLIKKAGLGLIDGTTFGKNGSGYQRINVACPISILQEAMTKLKNAVELLR